MSIGNANSFEPVTAAMLVVSDVLEAGGVRYALIGGLAAAQHGVFRATQDADFLIAIPSLRLPGLLEELQQAGCDVDLSRVIREWGTEHVTQFRCRGVPIDWLEPVIPLFQTVLDRAKVVSILSHRVRVVDAEGAMLMKLAAFRPEDRRDVEALASVCASVDWAFVRGQLESVFGPEDERLAWLAAVVQSGSA